MESFQEVAAVDAHGHFPVASVQRRLELRHIGLDHLRIQAKRVTDREDGLFP